jgi:hypothetical protein
MKTTQAYAWLAAGVLAAGLNASYHDGGLQRVHEIVDRVGQNSATALTVASGRADQFLSEMRWVTEREKTASCPLARALARAQGRISQTEIARNQERLDRLEAMADWEQARMEFNRARIEAQIVRIQVPAMALKPMVFSAPNVSECPRVRVSMPRLPRIQVPEIPVIHVESALTGPI